MVQNSTVLSFFPTFVWVSDLTAEERDHIGRTAVSYVDRLLTPRPPVKHREQWQTRTDLQTAPEFEPLSRLVLASARGILDYLRLKPAPLEITGAWANINLAGATHREHSHPNNFLSFVYYALVPASGSAIEFHDPRAQAHVIAPPVQELTAKTSSTAVVSVQTGRLVAFPSWLRHSVPAHHGEGERISIALNVMFSESIGKPRWSGRDGTAT